MNKHYKIDPRDPKDDVEGEEVTESSSEQSTDETTKENVASEE